MGKGTSKDPIFTPELLKILKIFGIASVFIVLLLSFFNEKRANNTGEDQTFKVNDSNRLFFLNLKAIHYDREARSDAKMLLFRHKDRNQEENERGLDLVIIQNSLKDEAYIYLEPKNIDWPLNIKAFTLTDSASFTFENGNAQTFLSYVNSIKPWVDAQANFSIESKDGWQPLWQKNEEQEAIKEILNDYFKLLEDK